MFKLQGGLVLGIPIFENIEGVALQGQLQQLRFPKPRAWGLGLLGWVHRLTALACWTSGHTREAFSYLKWCTQGLVYFNGMPIFSGKWLLHSCTGAAYYKHGVLLSTAGRCLYGINIGRTSDSAGTEDTHQGAAPMCQVGQLHCRAQQISAHVKHDAPAMAAPMLRKWHARHFSVPCCSLCPLIPGTSKSRKLSDWTFRLCSALQAWQGSACSMASLGTIAQAQAQVLSCTHALHWLTPLGTLI